MKSARAEREKEGLQPTDLNQLIQLIKPENAEAGVVKVTAKHSLAQDLPFFVVQKPERNERFIIFNITKDSKTRGNEIQLPYIGEVIEAFRSLHHEEKGTLLIPLRQCRGYLELPLFFGKARKEHIVLVEVDLATQTMRTHDSQGGLVRWTAYPDAMEGVSEAQNLEYKYKGYGVQKDHHACGYYVYDYILARLQRGKDFDLGRVFVNPKITKKEYLDLCGLKNNSSQANPNIEAKEENGDDVLSVVSEEAVENSKVEEPRGRSFSRGSSSDK